MLTQNYINVSGGQKGVPGVFSVEKCEFNSDESIVTMQLRNDSEKVMNSFLLLYRFFDESNGVETEICAQDDTPLFAKLGELTHESVYSVKSQVRVNRIAVYVADISYKDGSRWTNEKLVLLPESQMIVKMEREVAGLYSVERCRMDITKLELQLKNLSQDKTINSYLLLVRYLNVLGNEEKYSSHEFNCYDAKIKPREVSEKAVWSVFPGQYKAANCYVSEIVYSDGTKWSNPNIPPQESE